MKIKTKMTLISSLLMVIPTIIVALSIGWIAITSGQQALEEQARNQLISVRETTRNSIERLFHTLRGQIITFSEDRMVIDAMKLMPSAYQIYTGQKELGGSAGKQKLEAMRKELDAFYRGPFAEEFEKRNGGQKPPVDEWLSRLGDTAVALQYTYLAANPNPLERKDELIKVGDNSLYDSLHQRFHPSFNSYRKQFDYYDILLVDGKTGNVVYSVYKEIDFGTSLKTGPWAGTDLARVFQRANAAEKEDFVAISDYQPYAPSYNDNAAFMASPIFDKGKKIGVLVFQLPISKISAVMTHQGRWQEVGLGSTGETYLVGEDHSLRSGSRGQMENEQAFLASQASPEAAQRMRDKGSAVGLLKMDTPAVEAALAGQDGFMRYVDDSGREKLSAFAPVDIEGLKWVLLAEMDADEALQSVGRLKTRIAAVGFGIGLGVLLLGGLIGLLVGRLLVRPIDLTVDAIRDIAEGDGDLTQRIDIHSKDELGELAYWFNRFMDKLQSLIRELSQVTGQLGESSHTLAEVSSETREAIDRQCLQTESAATAIHQLTASVQEEAQLAVDTANHAREASSKADESQKTVQQNIQTIQQLSRTVEDTSQVIARLEQDSTDIGGVLDVIRNIAEQTNLLALNAAIEAARAGEQGRGFAVVADEVRTLASRTQESTQEIQAMIERLQCASKEAVASMTQTREQAEQGREYANRTGGMLDEISSEIARVSEMNAQISHSVDEQSAAATGISKNVEDISALSEKTAEGTRKTASASKSLSQLARQLQKLVNQFRV